MIFEGRTRSYSQRETNPMLIGNVFGFCLFNYVISLTMHRSPTEKTRESAVRRPYKSKDNSLSAFDVRETVKGLDHSTE